MIYEERDERRIWKWEIDENTRLPNGKLYNYVDKSLAVKSIEIPSGVTEIRYGAFAVDRTDEEEFSVFNPNVEEIDVPSSVQYVENGAFAFLNLKRLNVAPDCSGLKKVGNAVLSGDGKRLIYFLDTGMSDEYVVPSGVTEIGNEAFSACNANVTLPSGVKVIRANAFGFFSGRVVVPESVEKIEDGAFENRKFREKAKTELFVKKGSYAHKWARKNKVFFKIVKYNSSAVVGGREKIAAQTAERKTEVKICPTFTNR